MYLLLIVTPKVCVFLLGPSFVVQYLICNHLAG